MRPAFPESIAGVPLLIAEPEPSAHSLPVVFWCHGFGADALAHAGELERCAAQGFLAVGIDAPDHGARHTEQLAERLQASGDGALPVMLDLVRRGIAELPLLVEALAATRNIDRTRISLVGISMGAFLGYGALAAGVPLRAVVALLGSPEWPGPGSPHLSTEAFRDVALLSITAEHDTHVPPGPANRLHVDLALRYPMGRHRYHVLRGAGHLTSGAQWEEAMRETLAWLVQVG